MKIKYSQIPEEYLNFSIIIDRNTTIRCCKEILVSICEYFKLVNGNVLYVDTSVKPNIVPLLKWFGLPHLPEYSQITASNVLNILQSMNYYMYVQYNLIYSLSVCKYKEIMQYNFGDDYISDEIICKVIDTDMIMNSSSQYVFSKRWGDLDICKRVAWLTKYRYDRDIIDILRYWHTVKSTDIVNMLKYSPNDSVRTYLLSDNSNNEIFDFITNIADSNRQNINSSQSTIDKANINSSQSTIDKANINSNRWDTGFINTESPRDTIELCPADISIIVSLPNDLTIIVGDETYRVNRLDIMDRLKDLPGIDVSINIWIIPADIIPICMWLGIPSHTKYKTADGDNIIDIITAAKKYNLSSNCFPGYFCNDISIRDTLMAKYIFTDHDIDKRILDQIPMYAIGDNYSQCILDNKYQLLSVNDIITWFTNNKYIGNFTKILEHIKHKLLRNTSGGIVLVSVKDVIAINKLINISPNREFAASLSNLIEKI